METNPKYFFVGLSLIILLLVTAGGFLWLTKLRKDRDQAIYITYFRNSSLDGLQEGSIITMRGIPVGNVKSLEFVANDIERVRVFLSLKNSIPVKADTRAILQRNLLTGQATIDLVKSTQAAPLLRDLPLEGDYYPVIKEGQGEVEAIKNRLPDFLNRMEAVINNLNAVLSKENQDSLQQTLNNINSITADLTKEGRKPGEAVEKYAKLAEEIGDAVKTIDKAAVDIKKVLDPLVKAVSQSTQAITKGVSQAAARFNETIKGFQNPRGIITGPSESNLGPGETDK